MAYIPLRDDLYGVTSLLDFRKETARPICDLTHFLLRGENSLTEAERELIAAHVSALNECTFCSTAHTAATCLLQGGSEPGVKPMVTAISEIQLTDKMKQLLHLAALVQQGGWQVSQEDIDTAKAHGITDLEIHDTVLIAALFCMYNRYVDGLATRTPTDPSYYEALGKRITTRGYKMPEDGYSPLESQG